MKALSKSLSVDIFELAANPAWIPRVAEWHHEEWLRGLNSDLMAASHTEARCNLLRRVELLQEHCQSAAIPCTFVGVSAEEPIGSVSVVYYTFTRSQMPSVWLSNVYVEEQWRRRGIAAALIEHACRYAAEQGVQTLRLYTHNQAAYYAKRGWTLEGLARVQSLDVSVFSRILA